MAQLDRAGGAMTQREALKAMQQCLHGRSDLELRRFLLAMRPMIRSLEVLGGWTYIAVRELRANVSKIESSPALLELPDSVEPTLAAVLAAEGSAGLHGVGVVADESAAMGLLWICRFLSM